jgi:hypothetical protein
MMSSATSTSLGQSDDSARTAGFRARHLYLLLGMAAATWAVIVSDHTEPAALLLLSAAVLAAGVVGAALHEALLGFFGATDPRPAELAPGDREALEAEKKLVVRSIKELEFDHAMRKVGDADFAEILGRLRTRAMSLMVELERLPARPSPPPSPAAPVPAAASEAGTAARFCGTCGAERVADARFCSQCGARLA